MRNCEECNGSGKSEARDCYKQSNECCGGCYREVKCEECNGTGTYQFWNSIEEEFSDFVIDWNLTKKEIKYLIDNTNFKN